MDWRIDRNRALSMLALLVGVVLLMFSARSDRLWTSFGLFLLGMGFVSVPLLRLNDHLARMLGAELDDGAEESPEDSSEESGEAGEPDEPPEAPAEWPWIAGGVAVAGAALTGVAMRLSWWPVVAAIGVILLTIGLIGLHVWFSRRRWTPGGQVAGFRDDEGDGADAGDFTLTTPVEVRREPDPGALPLGGMTWVGLELLGVGVGLAWLGSGAIAVIGGLVWVAGLIAVKIGVVDFLRAQRGRFRPTVRVLIDIAVGGLIVLVAGAVTSSGGLVWIGMTIVMVSLSVLGLAATYCECAPRRAHWLAGGGAVAVALLTWWVAAIMNNAGLGIVAGLLVAAVGMWFVFRGEGIVLLMLVGYVIAWGLVDRTATVEADPHEGAAVRVLSIGDSFISGEGAATYLAGTNDVGADRNECRRAPTAYSYLLADTAGYSLDFVACSGAKIQDLFVCGQMSPDAERCKEPDEWAEVIAAGEAGGGTPGELPQLLNFTEAELQEFDLVVMSIGGNDVGFSSIVKACLLPKGCEERSQIWLDNVDVLGPRLAEAYDELQAMVSATTPIIAMPYPMMVTDEPCGAGLSGPEHEFVVRFIDALNDEIEEAADDAGILYFRPSETAFDGAQLCDDPAAANHLKMAPPGGGWLARYSPATWIHDSMHPNELGHELIFERLAPSVASLLASGEPGDELLPGPVTTDDVSPVEQVNADEAAELLTDDEWINEELFRTIRALVLPLVLLLVAGMLFAAGVVQHGEGDEPPDHLVGKTLHVVGKLLRPRDAEL